MQGRGRERRGMGEVEGGETEGRQRGDEGES